MHIPDGFIPLWQCAIYYVILIIALYFATKWAKNNLDEKRIPLMAVLAAGIFAIMSMNMPIPFGTSGHMVGGTLIAVVFMAPEAAILVFFVGDGGISTLGANVLNMAIVGGCVGLYTFKGLKKFVGKYVAVGIGAWLATFIAAECCAVEMAIAGTFPLSLGLASMGLYHAFIGFIEAILTVIVLYVLERYRPDLLSWDDESETSEA